MQIVTVSWPDTVALRQEVLGWSAQPVNGDEEPETTHLAAIDHDGHPIGVVTMVALPCPEYPDRPGTHPFYERCGAAAVGPSYTDDVTGLVDRCIIFTLDR